MGEIETAFPPGKLDATEREPPGWVVVLALVAGMAIVGGTTLGGYWSLSSRAPRRPEPPVSTVPPPTSNLPEGSNPNQPSLPPDDGDFVDTRGGWGWGDKCWIHLKAGKWGWAKAECDEGMRLGPASPQPRASLLYNEALIARQAGDINGARAALVESLRLREHPEVRAALNALPATN